MIFEKYNFFIEIAAYESISKAADHLFLSPSALSKSLGRLETSLNTKLFDRQTLPLRLTQSGKLFLRYVLQAIDLEKQCLQQIKNLNKSEIQPLRVGIGRWRGSCFLPLILPDFQKQHPNIEVEIVEGTSDALADFTLKNKVDISIMGGFCYYNYLNNIPLANERIFLVGNRKHPLVRKALEAGADRNGFYHLYDIRQLQQERIILSSPQQGLAQSVENYFVSINFTPFFMSRIEDLHTSTFMVAKSDCFTFIPEIGLHSLALPRNIVCLTIGNPLLLYPLAIVYGKNFPLSPTAQLFTYTVHEYYLDNSLGLPI